MIDWSSYHLSRLEPLSSPRLLVYARHLDDNIAAMRGALESVVPGSGFRHLTPHVKTHKSAWVTRRLIAAGIERFKVTPNELDSVLAAGARDVVLSYPPLPDTADLLARRIREHPERTIVGQIAAPEHATFLADAARVHGVEIPVVLDLDVGMGRTGSSALRLAHLAARVSQGEFPGLRIVGIHAYDGHNHAVDVEEKRRISREAMARAAECVRSLEEAGVRCPRVLVAGSPPFREDLDQLVHTHGLGDRVEVSPGTWVYWDTNYESQLPSLFRIAAVVLAQVMDRPTADRVTLNVGHKRWSIDEGPFDEISVPGVEFVSASEEHTVLRCGPDAPDLRIGDRLLIAPRHICPTVNLWGSFTVIDAQGEVLEENVPIDARNP